MRTYGTRAEAIIHEIVAPIQVGEVSADDYDIGMIADRLVRCSLVGLELRYYVDADNEEFWRVISDNARIDSMVL